MRLKHNVQFQMKVGIYEKDETKIFDLLSQRLFQNAKLISSRIYLLFLLIEIAFTHKSSVYLQKLRLKVLFQRHVLCYFWLFKNMLRDDLYRNSAKYDDPYISKHPWKAFRNAEKILKSD